MNTDKNGAEPLITASKVGWNARRALLLHEACTLISERVKNGDRVGRVIVEVAQKFANSDLGSGHRLALSARTLERIWYLWKASKDPNVFELNYTGHAGRKVDPILLRLVIAHSLQTGASLSDAIGAIRAKGGKISIRDVLRNLPARAIDDLGRSHRQLEDRRKRIEKKFLSSIERLNRRLLRQQAQLHKSFLQADSALRRRMIRQRERLQRRFLEGDARAVREREKIQRIFLSRTESTAT